MSLNDQVLKHLFANTVKGDTEDSCWRWIGSKVKFGYGRITVGTGSKRKYYQAHRVSYEYYNQTINPDLAVLHSCDNGECTNPKHLRQGTDQDNATDRQVRGRVNAVVGEAHPLAKLTEQQVIEIFKMQGKCISQDLADKYSVNKTTIQNIWNKKIWVQVTDAIPATQVSSELLKRLKSIKLQ